MSHNTSESKQGAGAGIKGMDWFVLRNRRHIGPYTELQLRKLLTDRKVSSQDYVLSKADSEKGIVNYVSLAQLLKLDPSEITQAGTLRPSQESLIASEESSNPFSLEEVTRLFEDQVDPVVLANVNQRRQDEKDTEASFSQENTPRSTVPNLLEALAQKFSEKKTSLHSKRLFFVVSAVLAVFGALKILKTQSIPSVATSNPPERGLASGSNAPSERRIEENSQVGLAPSQKSLKVPQIQSPSETSAPQDNREEFKNLNISQMPDAGSMSAESGSEGMESLVEEDSGQEPKKTQAKRGRRSPKMESDHLIDEDVAGPEPASHDGVEVESAEESSDSSSEEYDKNLENEEVEE